jgi:hypothetical protein
MASTQPPVDMPIEKSPAAEAAPANAAGEPPEKPAIISDVGDVVQSRGVTRMEAVYREARSNRVSFWLIGASVLVCAWAYSLDSSTTSYYRCHDSLKT